ncbi:uncharacterized protein I303_102913 [Kwoniella dejecticola CBS 10117]|uniref:Uncharacterized protein n=1 Tax=Kwoniella dejecticola CBS 10117 TaxID=1296121 RepID=A0AAJ8KL05_9TREE
MISQGIDAIFKSWIVAVERKVKFNEYQPQHYPAVNGTLPSTECFLEVSDEPFRIVIKKKSDDHSKLRLDRVYEKREGKTFESALRFSPLATPDDQAAVTLNGAQLMHLGRIDVVFRYGSFPPIGKGSHQGREVAAGIADENSATTKPSKEVVLPEKLLWTCDSASNWEGKVGYRFVFNYRPGIVLRQMGIIEATPKPIVEQSVSQGKKRARPQDVDSARSDVDELKEEEETDVKPDMQASRDRYLEDQVKMLSSQNKQLRKKGATKIPKKEVIDLSIDSE